MSNEFFVAGENFLLWISRGFHCESSICIFNSLSLFNLDNFELFIQHSGTKEISDYVAKERFIDEVPTLSHHATDARMYQACGLLLNE